LCGSPGTIDAVLINLESKKMNLDNTHDGKFLDAGQFGAKKVICDRLKVGLLKLK